MESVPGAVATGSQLISDSRFAKDCYPVATAPGTDLIQIETLPDHHQKFGWKSVGVVEEDVSSGQWELLKVRTLPSCQST
jgi:hypothetical protein